MATRVLLVDDHRMFVAGLRSLLDGRNGLKVVGEAHDGLEAIKAARRTHPNVVVMGITMPGMNGIEATREILAQRPSTRVLCLSAHSEKRFVAAALDAGAAGYLLKECGFEELVEAIDAVRRNQVYLHPKVAGTLVEAYRSQRGEDANVFSLLTRREREVLQLLAEGQSTKDIAGRLGLSLKTVGTHRAHVMDKLGIHSVAGLTKYAIREGLTTADE